ncbi:MAG: diguanylate cyclase [Oscillospiraceae bacterium]|nr:diguanylate cyclase [Oscillospiraceae bacterium]
MARQNKQNKSTANRILVIELVIMILLLLVVTTIVSNRTRQNALDHMATVTDERSKIVSNYVDRAEAALTAYSRSAQIINLLKNPDNDKALQAAQKYTVTYSKDIPFLEGIYASKWTTQVLVHTNSKIAGMITRKTPESLEQLQNAMLEAGNGVYDTGIISSPASHKQIVSMYKAVYDENMNPIGLVGIGIFTDGLISDLDKLASRDLEQSTYSMIDVATKQYIFHANSYMIQKEAETPEVLALCDRFSNPADTSDTVGNFEFKEDGVNYVSAYSYMPDHNWILMFNDTRSEVYGLTYAMRLFLLLFGLLMIGLMIVFHLLNKRAEQTNQKLSSQLVKTERTKQSLTTAMFQDILTEANNRVSFSMDASKLNAVEDGCYYFVFFNISEFSQINSTYGNDAGDQVLLSTVQALRKVFLNGKIYRTGSDEFLIVIPSNDSTEAYNDIINNVNTAHAILLTPHETPAGQINAEYKIAVAKKSDNINASIISSLKDLTNRNGVAVFGQVQYLDLDQAN